MLDRLHVIFSPKQWNTRANKEVTTGSTARSHDLWVFKHYQEIKTRRSRLQRWQDEMKRLM
jgi:hypothetical protein